MAALAQGNSEEMRRTVPSPRPKGRGENLCHTGSTSWMRSTVEQFRIVQLMVGLANRKRQRNALSERHYIWSLPL